METYEAYNLPLTAAALSTRDMLPSRGRVFPGRSLCPRLLPCAVCQSGCLACENLPPYQTVIDQVECELQHPLHRRALSGDLLGPLKSRFLQFSVRHDSIDHAHPVCVLSRVGLA